MPAVEVCVREKKIVDFLRMLLEYFNELLFLVGPKMEKLEHYRTPIDPPKRLQITLRYLACGDSMISL